MCQIAAFALAAAPVARQLLSASRSCGLLSVTDPADEVSQRAADLIGAIFLDEVAPFHRHFGLVQPGAAKFPLPADQNRTGICIALGFDWAMRNRDRVQGIVYMEAIVTPLTWADWPENARRAFQGFRSESGEEMILEKNMFVERVLPASIIRRLSEEEMAAYRKPFASPGEDRRPTLTWPRMIPIEGKPADMVKVVENYAAWLAETDVPKLYINAEPGSILVGRQRELCRAWPNQTEVAVKGRHFVQEDSPDEIGQAVARPRARRRPVPDGPGDRAARARSSARSRRPRRAAVSSHRPEAEPILSVPPAPPSV
jgi:hypothetical protein